MSEVTPASIRQAASLLKGVALETPLIYAPFFSERLGCEIFFKAENLQRTGSFKIRGAFCRLSNLTAAEKARGVVTASAGNHAQGLAFAARALHIKAKVFMPRFASLKKTAATRELGAEVVLTGEDYNAAYEEALSWSGKNGLPFIHAFDDPHIIAGQGTVALEFLKQLPHPDAVVVPVGGGGLLAGISVMTRELSPGSRIIGVQSQRADAARETFYCRKAAGHPAGCATLADGIAVKRPGRLTMEILRQRVDAIVCVDEEDIAEALLLLLDQSKLVVEGAGAVGLAALLMGQIPLKRGAKVVVVLSGGNIDVHMLDRIIERGLVRGGRLLRVTCTLEDRPGALQGLVQELADLEANILQIQHDRLMLGLPLHTVRVEVLLETRNIHHGRAIMKKLKEKNIIKLSN